MPGKQSAGFTKSAQSQKFLRNRDLKLKDSELAKEAKIERLMCEGVCDRCREKVQWRFRYDKYKPLTAPGKCLDCMNKTVTKAYRTICDGCATAKKICGSCQENIEEANNTRRLAIEKTKRKAAVLDTTAISATTTTDDTIATAGVEMSTDNTDDSMQVSADGSTTNKQEQQASTSTDSIGLKASHWDENKFTSIRDTKYSKQRPVGGTDDVFTFNTTTTADTADDVFND